MERGRLAWQEWKQRGCWEAAELGKWEVLMPQMRTVDLEMEKLRVGIGNPVGVHLAARRYRQKGKEPRTPPRASALRG